MKQLEQTSGSLDQLLTQEAESQLLREAAISTSNALEAYYRPEMSPEVRAFEGIYNFLKLHPTFRSFPRAALLNQAVQTIPELGGLSIPEVGSGCFVKATPDFGVSTRSTENGDEPLLLSWESFDNLGEPSRYNLLRLYASPPNKKSSLTIEGFYVARERITDRLETFYTFPPSDTTPNIGKAQLVSGDKRQKILDLLIYASDKLGLHTIKPIHEIRPSCFGRCFVYENLLAPQQARKFSTPALTELFGGAIPVADVKKDYL